jgi:thiamine biosynthesis lipoprotein
MPAPGPTARPHPPGVTASRSASDVEPAVRRMRPALGTWVVIEARGPHPEAALEGAFLAISEVQERLHPERDGSDLYRLCHAAPGEATLIHEDTFRVLRFAQRLCALSGGVFDPCLPDTKGRLDDLELGCTPEGRHWARCREALVIDCGGLAKGYAIDRAVTALAAGGCGSGLVNAGGDLRVFGAASHTVLVRRSDGRCEPCELRDEALAVSEPGSGRAPRGHRGYYRRGAPAPSLRGFAAVRAAQAMTADALTKCVLLCAPEVAGALVLALGGQVLE